MSLRVIAGLARGRILRGPDSDIRPTGDKVKGAIFSQLEALAYKKGYEPTDVENEVPRFAAANAWPVVLDLYAGSGALGIEALSRGAGRVDFVDCNVAARRLIEENLRTTGLSDRAAIHIVQVERAISTLVGSYDLILADPPYADSEAEQVLSSLAASSLVNDRTVLVWEHGSGREPPQQLGPLILKSTRRHGAAAISLYEAGSNAGAVDGRSEDRVAGG